MHKLQQDLSNMALAAQSNDVVSATDLRLPGQTTTTNHTYNLSQELVEAFDLSDADSDTTITELEQGSASLTSDDEISMRTLPTCSSDSEITTHSVSEANSEAASNIIDAEEYRRNQNHRRHYRYITQANAITAQLAGTTRRQTREPTANDLRYAEILVEERRQSRRNRPRSRSVDDYLSSLDNSHTFYPPITKITNSNPDVRREIDFEIRRPLEGTSDNILEDITAAEIGRIEPHKFTLCRCDYDDPTHVFVHTYPDIVVFDWYNEDDIMDLNLFRISIIAKTFNIDYLKTDTGSARSGDEIMKDG
jgi:hypothetical protein